MPNVCYDNIAIVFGIRWKMVDYIANSGFQIVGFLQHVLFTMREIFSRIILRASLTLFKEAYLVSIYISLETKVANVVYN